MKRFLFSLFLAGAALMAPPVQTARADDTTVSSPAAVTNGTPTEARGRRLERFKEAMAQLDLTEAQKDEIKQIRARVTDHKERRQQILGVLTPEQKATLRELIQAHENGAPTGGAARAGN